MATRKHILVVDDDSYVRESTEEILRRKGYDVDTASDGKGALAKLGEADYDLILSDIKMPGMDGIELLETAHGKYPQPDQHSVSVWMRLVSCHTTPGRFEAMLELCLGDSY